MERAYPVNSDGMPIPTIELELLPSKLKPGFESLHSGFFIASCIHMTTPRTKPSLKSFTFVSAPFAVLYSRKCIESAFFITLFYSGSSIYRCIKSFFKSHAPIHSAVNSYRLNTHPFHVPGSSIIKPIDNRPLNGTRVINLFYLVRPFTVFGGIISVVINTINTVALRRFFTHIINEIYKTNARFKPPIANFNSASTIIFIVVMIFAITTFSHALITIVFISMICAGYLYVHKIFSYPYNTILLTANIMGVKL